MRKSLLSNKSMRIVTRFVIAICTNLCYSCFRYSSIFDVDTVVALSSYVQKPTPSLVALQPKKKNNGSKRYFYSELTLPPLVSIQNDPYSLLSKATTKQRVNSDDHYSHIFQSPSLYSVSDLPVIYTNDPKIVSRWLSDNIPSTGCTIGFDVEVSLAYTDTYIKSVEAIWKRMMRNECKERFRILVT